MAIDQIGVPASVPQQFEQLITSSGNWSVPAGVKTVEVLMAGGGGSNQARAGVSKFLYNVQGKTSIPVTIGARAGSNGQAGGTTTFDSNLVATGGFYEGDTNFRGGNFVNLLTEPAVGITGNTPLSARTSYSDGTTARFRYFAAFNGRGVAVSSDGTLAATTVNNGSTWTKVTSITGVATNFAGIVSERDMLLHHNGGLWLLFSTNRTNYAYSVDGTTWVVANHSGVINDMIAVGSSSSRAVVIVSDSNHSHTSNITTTAPVSVFGNRGDVIFRAGGDSTLVSFRGGQSPYYWSNNGGATWNTSSYSGISLQSVSRWSKSYSFNDATIGVMFQRGQNSSSFTAIARNPNGNNQYFWQSWDSINSGSGGNTSSPNGSFGTNTISVTMHLYRPQTFNESDFGAFATWVQSGTMFNRTDAANYGFLNTSDGSMTGSNHTLSYIGGNNVYDVSEYVIGDASPFRVLFGDNNRSDGFIYRAAGYVGHGVASGSIQSGFTSLVPSASGEYFQNQYGTTNPANSFVYGSGEEGWGRSHNQLPGLGYGGVSQNGAVRLRWWA